MNALPLVDPATNPYLRDRFAPVHREIDTSDVRIEGDLPADLVGTYIRNGPNPRFPPLGSYSYPMEGDGMLHGVWIEPGHIRYRNRWVRTNGMRAEERAGRALYGGVMTPAFVDMALLGDDPDPGWPTKLDAFINIVHHAGRWLALEEGTPAYEVTAELETVGRFDFAGGLPAGLTAHPKVDPRTGEMVVFRYDVEQPYLTWAVIGSDGTVTRPATPVDGVEHSVMIHDFAITARWIVIVVAPAVFDIDAMLKGDPLLSWRPELGTRVALLPRDGNGPTRWIEGDAWWVWHLANAFDDGDAVTVDLPMWRAPGFLSPGTENDCAFVRAVLDPTRETMDVTRLHDAFCDFPRVPDSLVSREERYVVLTAGVGGHDIVPGEHDALCRVDLTTGEWVQFEPGGVVGEAVIAPRPGATDELDAYYLAFVTTFGDPHTSLAVWDAAAFPGPPRAVIHLPQRVPNGLHGNWFAAR
ncbi:MAG: carotenoid oxygenase family protein [Ilumatobacteraceae bacterium]